MKHVKVWFDFDSERYSTEGMLIEEFDESDILYKEDDPDGNHDIVKAMMFEVAREHNLVVFAEIESEDVFTIPAEAIVKIEVLEE